MGIASLIRVYHAADNLCDAIEEQDHPNDADYSLYAEVFLLRDAALAKLGRTSVVGNPQGAAAVAGFLASVFADDATYGALPSAEFIPLLDNLVDAIIAARDHIRAG